MATHRKPPLSAVPPPELLQFDPDEWPAEQWWQSADAWGHARMQWVKTHPNTAVGTKLDVLREQRRLFDEHRQAKWELNGAAS
jgi:hypothetical protein